MAASAAAIILRRWSMAPPSCCARGLACWRSPGGGHPDRHVAFDRAAKPRGRHALAAPGHPHGSSRRAALAISKSQGKAKSIEPSPLRQRQRGLTGIVQRASHGAVSSRSRVAAALTGDLGRDTARLKSVEISLRYLINMWWILESRRPFVKPLRAPSGEALSPLRTARLIGVWTAGEQR